MGLLGNIDGLRCQIDGLRGRMGVCFQNWRPSWIDVEGFGLLVN